MEGGATTKTSRQGPRLSPDVTSGEVWQCRWLHWPETDQRLQMSAGNSRTLRLSSLHHHSHHRHLPSAIPVICAFNLRNRDRLQPTVTPCRAAPARFASCTIIELFWKIRYWKFSADTKRMRETVDVIGTKKRIPNRYCWTASLLERRAVVMHQIEMVWNGYRQIAVPTETRYYPGHLQPPRLKGIKWLGETARLFDTSAISKVQTADCWTDIMPYLRSNVLKMVGKRRTMRLKWRPKLLQGQVLLLSIVSNEWFVKQFTIWLI